MGNISNLCYIIHVKAFLPLHSLPVCVKYISVMVYSYFSLGHHNLVSLTL